VNFSVVKFVTPDLLKPFGLNVVRVLVTTGLLWLMHIWERPGQPLLKKDLPLFIACGLTGIAINQLLFIKGLSITYSIHASLLMLCTPLLITISAFFFLKKITTSVITGLIIGITGMCCDQFTKELDWYKHRSEMCPSRNTSHILLFIWLNLSPVLPCGATWALNFVLLFLFI
jgi:hypothetical protein